MPSIPQVDPDERVSEQINRFGDRYPVDAAGEPLPFSDAEIARMRKQGAPIGGMDDRFLRALAAKDAEIERLTRGFSEGSEVRAKLHTLRESMRLDAETIAAKDARIAELEAELEDAAKVVVNWTTMYHNCSAMRGELMKDMQERGVYAKNLIRIVDEEVETWDRLYSQAREVMASNQDEHRSAAFAVLQIKRRIAAIREPSVVIDNKGAGSALLPAVPPTGWIPVAAGLPDNAEHVLIATTIWHDAHDAIRHGGGWNNLSMGCDHDAPSMRKWPAYATYQDWLGGRTCPKTWEWLMGWPIGWTDCTVLVTVSFRSWWSRHGGI